MTFSDIHSIFMDSHAINLHMCLRVMGLYK